MGPPQKGPEKNFRNRSSQTTEKAISNFILAKNRAILLTFSAEFTERVLDILSYPESIITPTMVRPAKNFQNGGCHMAGQGYFETGFCKYSIS